MAVRVELLTSNGKVIQESEAGKIDFVKAKLSEGRNLIVAGAETFSSGGGVFIFKDSKKVGGKTDEGKTVARGGLGLKPNHSVTFSPETGSEIGIHIEGNVDPRFPMWDALGPVEKGQKIRLIGLPLKEDHWLPPGWGTGSS